MEEWIRKLIEAGNGKQSIEASEETGKSTDAVISTDGKIYIDIPLIGKR